MVRNRSLSAVDNDAGGLEKRANTCDEIMMLPGSCELGNRVSKILDRSCRLQKSRYLSLSTQSSFASFSLQPSSPKDSLNFKGDEVSEFPLEVEVVFFRRLFHKTLESKYYHSSIIEKKVSQLEIYTRRPNAAN